MSALYFSPAYRPAFRFNGALSRLRSFPQGNAPAYDIEKVGEQAYRITVAVPGFGSDELAVTVRPNQLLVTGQRRKAFSVQPLRQGIVNHDFERRFELDDHLEVTGASLRNGLLTIELERRDPEPLRSRTIKINDGSSKPKPIEQVRRRAASVFQGAARWLGRARALPAVARHRLGW